MTNIEKLNLQLFACGDYYECGSCEVTCQSCLSGGEGCGSCETSCESICQTSCQSTCTTACESEMCGDCQVVCMETCLSVCQDACLLMYQACGDLWEWENAKASGGDFNLTATEWLNFCTKINQFRVANGLAEYPFTTSPDYIATGKDYYAWIFLQAANAINDLKGEVAVECLNVASGDDIYAWYYDNLRTALNNAGVVTA